MLDVYLATGQSIASSKIWLFKTAPDIDEPPCQFIHTMDLSVANMMQHDSPDLIIHRTEIWAVWRPQVGHKKVWHFLMQQFNCCTCAVRCVGALSCWNTKSLPDTLHIAGSSMTSLMTHYDVMKLHRRSQLSPEFPACIATTMKLPHALQIYSTVFVKKCMWLHFSR